MVGMVIWFVEMASINTLTTSQSIVFCSCRATRTKRSETRASRPKSTLSVSQPESWDRQRENTRSMECCFANTVLEAKFRRAHQVAPLEMIVSSKLKVDEFPIKEAFSRTISMSSVSMGVAASLD
mmetsp:Transcript_9313/g.14698  ORF Transcript_9313/g.14698 Transcript_9313/m.14698 type:complete len:125 (+) Transcript_9313:1113-1487(+)